MNYDQKINRMTERISEEFVLQIVFAVVVFIPFGFGSRLLSSYLLGGDLLLSSITGITGTLLSLIIFFSISQYSGLSTTLLAGLAANTVLLLVFYLLFGSHDNLNLKYKGSYLFQDGHVTIQGILHYIPLAFWDSLISCLDFAIYWKLYQRIVGGRA